jgi:hypothetical protein
MPGIYIYIHACIIYIYFDFQFVNLKSHICLLLYSVDCMVCSEAKATPYLSFQGQEQQWRWSKFKFCKVEHYHINAVLLIWETYDPCWIN